MRTSTEGVALIKRHEGLRLAAYLDAVGVPTIGYGHTGDVKLGHTGDVKLGQRVTEHQADVILQHDLERFEEGVADLTRGVALKQGQFDALVSFSFNLGLTAFANSALRKRLLQSDTYGAACEFAKWIHAGGRVLPGLVARRKDEAELFER